MRLRLVIYHWPLWWERRESALEIIWAGSSTLLQWSGPRPRWRCGRVACDWSWCVTGPEFADGPEEEEHGGGEGGTKKREDEDEDEDEVVENESSTKPVKSGPPSVPGHRDTWGTHDPAQFAHSVRFLSLAQPWGELQLLASSWTADRWFLSPSQTNCPVAPPRQPRILASAQGRRKEPQGAQVRQASACCET